MAPRWDVALAVAAVMVAFAGNSVITRYIIAGSLASPFMLTTVRFASGAAMLFLLTAALPATFPRRVPSRTDLVGGILLGAYAFSISFGYLFISAAAGTLVFYAFVVFTMALFAHLRDRDRLTPRSIGGQVLALVGVAVIAFGGIRNVSLPGVLLMAATGASWGLYSVHGRSATDVRAYTFSTFLVIGAFSLFLVPVIGPFEPGALWIEPSWNGLGLALFMGTTGTALSYVLWHSTLRRITALQGGIAQLLVPVLASGMGILLLGEPLTIALAVGGACVLAGIYLNRVNPRAA